jgi:hypothetical protein
MEALVVAPNQRMAEILRNIVSERFRQDQKWGEQNHPILHLEPGTVTFRQGLLAAREENAKTACALAIQGGHLDWNLIIGEEFAEALASASQGDLVATREELVQLAAVVLAAIERIDRTGALG